MGIDIYCTNRDCSFEGKQCFVYRRKLLDALRDYLTADESTYERELKYVNWLYREEDNSYMNITEEERHMGLEELKKKELDGLFSYIFLTEESMITYAEAVKFKKTFDKMNSFFYSKESRFLDLHIIKHAYRGKGNHNLRCW